MESVKSSINPSQNARFPWPSTYPPRPCCMLLPSANPNEPYLRMNAPSPNRIVFLSCLYAMAGLLPLPSEAADWFVTPDGKDSNPGTQEAPFLTLEAARNAARKVVGNESVTVHVADGVYYLPETLAFSPEDSGTADHPVTYTAINEGKAVISGGLRLKLDWTPYRDGILQAKTPTGLAIDQLFIDGVRQRMARYPNFDPAKTTAAYQGFSADAFSKERAARWSDPTGGFIHAMHVHRWGGYHYRITGKQPDGNVSYEGGWQNNRQMGMHPEFRMVENIFEELDAPGEWFHNAKTHTLYYMPGPGVDMTRSSVEVVRLSHLVEFNGSESHPVKHITLKGFVFRHAARTFMDNKEPLLRSDWTIYRGGAVTLTGTEQISILDSEFDQPGGNAVFVNFYNRNALIKGCHIHDTGASGVCFVGDPKAVRSPLFEYAKTQDLSKIDRTPGPQTNNYPADCTVEDSLIHGIGRVERQPAGVQISMASRITVKDCSIYDCARSGINISEGTWHGHLIDGCDVFGTVLETHDHGSFNSWGRDRYWSSNHRGVSMPEVKKDPKLPFLDAVATTTIRNSRWRCDHGWDVDLDDGSTNYDIYNNLMLQGGLKLREGYRRKAWNNVMINNGLHPHVWFDESGDTFHHNIVMKSHAAIGMPTGWNKDVNHNLFTSKAALNAARQAGGDADSVAADPMFVDPAKGDFRVREGSPALELGFKNFPMDRFGVKKSSLKALAQSPVIPPVSIQPEDAGAVTPKNDFFWLGAKLHALQGEEFSAFGTSREDGGIQLADVPKGSAAEAAGFKSNDLILTVNGRKTVGFTEWFAVITAACNQPLDLTVVRYQKAGPMKVEPMAWTAVETASKPDGFKKLRPTLGVAASVGTKPETGNDPIACLGDGTLSASYGAVMPNGVRDGAYKLDLGAVLTIRAVNSWAHNQNGNRGRQVITIYGSNSTSDPGWERRDRARFTPLGSIDTGAIRQEFSAASLRAATGKSLGSYRWLLIQVEPVSDLAENTSFQEFRIETN